MATNFPTNIDTFTDQTSSDLITSAKWNNLQDSIEALEEKVGADSSAITTSHDYKLAELAAAMGLMQTNIASLQNVGKIKARAYRNAAQNIGPGPSRILIDTISFNTESVIDIANSCIIPNLPGYYVVMGNVGANVPDSRMVNAMIYKNSEQVTYGTIDIQGAAGRSSSSVSDLIYMNGTTDYLELFAHNSHSTALALYTGNSYHNYISIVGPF